MLEIATTLAQRHEVTLLTVGKLDLEILGRFFGLPAQRLKVLSFREHPSALVRNLDRLVCRWPEGNVYKKMFTAIFGPEFVSGYDLFVNGESGDFIRNTAPKGLYLIFFPWLMASSKSPPGLIRRLYRMPYEFWRRRCYRDRWESYGAIYAVSQYSQHHVEATLNRTCGILYPPIDDEFRPLPKANRILMLGRFMDQDEKGQWFGTEQFKRLCQKIPGWELVCAGALWPDKRAKRFFRHLKRSTQGWPIRLLPNLPFADLKTLVGRSKIFWHAMGHGQDLVRHPELAEHFGMPTVECMRAGCVPLAFDGGGQPEIIDSGQSGYVWNKPEMLLDYTLQLARDPERWNRMSKAAMIRGSTFSRDRFKRTIFSAIDELVASR